VAYTMLLKRDKRSGIYRFRLQVPDDLRDAGLLGWEITRSLKTTNLAEAKRRYPAVLAWMTPSTTTLFFVRRGDNL
jgi:hypothetical protein